MVFSKRGTQNLRQNTYIYAHHNSSYSNKKRQQKHNDGKIVEFGQ